MVEKIRLRFTEKRRQALRGLEAAMGISFGELELLRQTVGEGLKSGRIKYNLGYVRDGRFGTLHYFIEENGKRIAKTRDVTHATEAAFLIGLQSEIAAKRE